ncbi:50S ribosomal protein L29 [Boudabousia tangfeifanii]|uniref:Large ribosomal subunit protein uL29 n=1 Tax=Boudabousia tangfeifanii TaxID=1912795 RepID=A0A1D9MIW1_9ACTO|nr:50S ribosomal protein L29 [Boudabousia tangfeifanii]AOZ72234.1 50S ribosomal protein L29 [Boudabousia tangfeifanii]
MAKSELSAVELDKMDDDRLREELDKAKTELFNLRFAQAAGMTENVGRIRTVRRDIARIYTIARERELNIRTAPTVK